MTGVRNLREFLIMIDSPFLDIDDFEYIGACVDSLKLKHSGATKTNQWLFSFFKIHIVAYMLIYFDLEDFLIMRYTSLQVWFIDPLVPSSEVLVDHKSDIVALLYLHGAIEDSRFRVVKVEIVIFGKGQGRGEKSKGS